MSTAFEARCRSLLTELGLSSGNRSLKVTPLTGGVSSDIGLVELEHRRICVKFALAQLKVEQQWFANTERNLAEYGWLQFASSVMPEAVPELLGCSVEAGGFAMEFIEGNDVYLWKRSLLEGRVIGGEAEMVGSVLGRIHRASATEQVLLEFQNQQDFHALRLEPYLLFTATRNPELALELNGLVEMLRQHELVLVHGDVSPKNIIFRNTIPVFLDAECATAGDPAFDLAFCLNHLVLKGLHLKTIREPLFAAVCALWSAYSQQVNWESPADLEQRVCRLLPAFMLARVDGKSPVEYLSTGEQQRVRAISASLLQNPERTVADVVRKIQLELRENE